MVWCPSSAAAGKLRPARDVWPAFLPMGSMLSSIVVAAGTSLTALRANPVRAALAMLGVVIGSGALVSVLAVSDGVESFARTRISRQGFDRVAIRPLGPHLFEVSPAAH